ncbi:MAG: GTPase HflX [Bacteroidetes bacterium]|nr:GTPase HflX [Bacteroidota bacterium]
MIEIEEHKRERAIAVGLYTHSKLKAQAEEYLDELKMLADTAGADIIHSLLQSKERIDSATYIGSGKVEQIRQLAEDEDISLILFDDDLTPAQTRNLENNIKRKIVDRSSLILDIFANRAKTMEAKTQVELAQLQYLLPRLTRMWTHLSKQYGGIRTKGPGETQIEADRRMLRDRIGVLKEKLEKIASQRTTQRKGRKEYYNIALIGYTNVGKSTLLNTLSDSSVFVENRLFATLDATTRMVSLSSTTPVLFTDTVGFIRKLPHHLIASFKSTLEEVTEADILLHVIDTPHPHVEDQIATVKNTIEELGASHKPVIYVFNKIDIVKDRSIVHELQTRYTPSIFISAHRGINISGLKEMILQMIHAGYEEMKFSLPHNAYKTLSQLRDFVEIVDQQYDEEKIDIVIRVSMKLKERVEKIIAPYIKKKKSEF